MCLEIEIVMLLIFVCQNLQFSWLIDYFPTHAQGTTLVLPRKVWSQKRSDLLNIQGMLP